MIAPNMPKKTIPGTPFGKKLFELRKAKGLTQQQLAQAIGSSQRAISHYETVGAFPPTSAIMSLAKTLGVTADELLGLKKSGNEKEEGKTQSTRLWKKVRKISSLPEKDQRAIIRMIKSLTANRQTQQ